ncbi:biotin transport system substrate-specific component [Oceanotoga teriensis]|uniref:Biotin transporter n=1 Tax=Oceanotoga teriensis TaxID=515440 RepID=A0AA45C6R2_9BACT|nr:biotin transporter BioY [Oceanotoga teriensis]PWJ93216.1 biotin transport system substrate-specific component [Oceanotoga teriensis]
MKAKDLCFISIFTVLTSVGAFIKIPTPIVPFTLQYVFVLLSGIILGSKKALLSQTIYLIIGLIGIPIFSQGGGISYVLNPTFGYLIGLFSEKIVIKNSLALFLYSLPGLIIMYLIGIIYFFLIMKYYYANEIIIKTFLIKIIPDFIMDIVLTYLTVLIGINIKRRLKIDKKII